MNTHPRKHLLLTVCAVLLAAAGVTGLALARRGQRQEHLPKEYRSEVKGLAIESVRVESERAMLLVVLRNKTGRGVTAYRVTVGDFHVGRDGGLLVDEPRVVIEPHGTEEVGIPLGNFIDDEPLVITEAFYDDGTEEGREELRGWTRGDRARAKAERAAKKGEPR
jgi:hypothetical protein